MTVGVAGWMVWCRDITECHQEVETMLANNLTKGEHIDGEEQGSKHRALRHALVDWSWGGTGVSNDDKLFPVC